MLNKANVRELFELPFPELVYQAMSIHRQNFDPTEVQTSTLMSIKTGGCPEDCGYCSQSGHHDADLERQRLAAIDEVVAQAKRAQETGATRFCMGAAWRAPVKRDFPAVLQMIKEVKALGMETCVTLGMLDESHTEALKEAGLDYYNHNVDTSESHYKNIVSTRTYKDRLDTLDKVRDAGIKVCSGAILGMGETRQDRIEMLHTLATLPSQPESVPLNQLVPIPGTPLENAEPVTELEFLRTIAVARIIMPKSYLRLSAGRETMSAALQATAFSLGINSIFYGDQLLTTSNPNTVSDLELFKQAGMKIKQPESLYYEAAS
ncbi:biotin synthase BioB [Salinibius halmophilus]|uniref:biotin synthase BioB n=1 Tax=Salinibius halmophilus TaxID=1853216 RepID=UPI000E66326F|nr:biotin synthase BioB [Salinibius halmophilus]